FHVEATNGSPANRGNNIHDFGKPMVYFAQGSSTPDVLNSIYNYGEKLNSQITHKTVDNGGRLYLYGNFVDSKTNNLPITGSQHDYFIGSGCSGTTLEIGNNGKLIIGDNAVSNDASLILQANATLVIKDGGTLQINDGSEFIVAD